MKSSVIQATLNLYDKLNIKTWKLVLFISHITHWYRNIHLIFIKKGFLYIFCVAWYPKSKLNEEAYKSISIIVTVHICIRCCAKWTKKWRREYFSGILHKNKTHFKWCIFQFYFFCLFLAHFKKRDVGLRWLLGSRKTTRLGFSFYNNKTDEK